MDIMKKITISSFQKNRKRTIVTMIGVMLATALITTVACMGESFRTSLIRYTIRSGGYIHSYVYGVPKENVKYFVNNKNVKKVSAMTDVGYAYLEGSKNEDKPYVCVKSLSGDMAEMQNLTLIDGRMPKAEDELVISKHIITNGGVKLTVGDEITLDIGKRISEKFTLDQNCPYRYEEETLQTCFTKTYKIVGIVNRPAFYMEPYIAPGYSVFTYESSEGIGEKSDLYLQFRKSSLRDIDKIMGDITGVSEETFRLFHQNISKVSEEDLLKISAFMENYEERSRLIMLETYQFKDSFMSMIALMAGLAIIIIVISSVFCIRNSFMISMTEKLRLYGMIASVGATRKQRKKMVYLEARYLSLIGVPLGIALGLLAALITTKGISILLKEAVEAFSLSFEISVPAILTALVVSVLTVFLSAGKSARMASKLSPLEAVKGNMPEKSLFGRIRKKKRVTFQTPKWIGAVFGIGGKLAYKNLKRSKVKYRTTVVSIVISVSVFIGLTTFTEEIEFLTKHSYREDGYQLHISLYEDDLERNEKIADYISGMNGITFIEYSRSVDNFRIPNENLSYTKEYAEAYGEEEADAVGIGIYSLGEQAFKKYCKEVGVSVEEARDKGIFINRFELYYWDEEAEMTKCTIGEYYDLKKGDVITGTVYQVNPYREEDWSIELAAVTDKLPMRLKYYGGNGFLIVSDEWLDAHKQYASENIQLRILCKDALSLENDILSYLEENHYEVYSIQNNEKGYKEIKALYVAIEILLYGFIIVIALIGVTNIINTVTTNMELRSREFAMLKSVGMTGREFRRMMLLENIFYGGKALLMGVPIGCVISYAFYRIMREGVETSFIFPLKGVTISVLAVILLLWMMMRFSIKKNASRNIIETITNENI